MKNLATAEEMEQLLAVYVQAVNHMRALQLCPKKLQQKNHRELLRRAEAEVDSLTALHGAAAPIDLLQPPSPDSTSFERPPNQGLDPINYRLRS